VIFPATDPASATALMKTLDHVLTEATANLPDLAAPALCRLQTAVLDPGGRVRHDRMISRWRNGAAPLPHLNARADLNWLSDLVADPSRLRSVVTDALSPAKRVTAVFEPSAPAAAAKPAPERAPRTSARTLQFRSPLPNLPSLPAADGLAHRALALSLEGIPTEDLAVAGLLIRHMADLGGLELDVLTGSRGVRVLLRATALPQRAADLDARLADLFAAPLPQGAALARLAATPTAGTPPHLLAALRLEAGFSRTAAVVDHLHGLSARDAQSAAPPDPARLARVRAALRAAAGQRLLTCGPAPSIEVLTALTGSDPGTQPLPPCVTASPDVHPLPGRQNTLGLAVQVRDTTLLPLAAHALEWLWLRQTVRRQGGAYGVRARVGPGGVLVLLSARDPHHAETFRRFEESAGWLARHLHGDLLARAIRGTLQRLARPLSPAEALLAPLRAELDDGPGLAVVFQDIATADAAAVSRLAAQLSAAMPAARRVAFLGTAS
jgi:hypothetical protein